MNTVLAPGAPWPKYTTSQPSQPIPTKAQPKPFVRRGVNSPSTSSIIREWVTEFPGRTGNQIAAALELDAHFVNRSLHTQIEYGKLRAGKKMSEASSRMTNHYYPLEKP